MSTLVELTYDTCVELLQRGPVGRVAVCTPDGPRVFPVNYSVVGGSIVFRTAPYTVLGSHAWNARLAFEVDEIDPRHESGWSVVATGRGHMVDDPDELARINATWRPVPWAGGQRWMVVALPWDELSGRRLGPRSVTMAQ